MHTLPERPRDIANDGDRRCVVAGPSFWKPSAGKLSPSTPTGEPSSATPITSIPRSFCKEPADVFRTALALPVSSRPCEGRAIDEMHLLREPAGMSSARPASGNPGWSQGIARLDMEGKCAARFHRDTFLIEIGWPCISRSIRVPRVALTSAFSEKVGNPCPALSCSVFSPASARVARVFTFDTSAHRPD